MNLYKATRPDGTDYRTGRVDYAAALESGATITHPEKFTRDVPATYLSVSTVPTDCTMMRWPCRLFRIEPVGRAWRNSNLPNKRCCSALRVVEELPAHEAFGPQGEEVAALIERVWRLTPDEKGRLLAARDAAWDAARTARDAAWYAARDAAWTARDTAWYAARDAARDAAWDAARTARDAAWYAARDAARDAALALLARDLISKEHFDALYGPWREVVG